MRIHVSFEAEVPADATPDEVEEWVRFQLNERGSMSASNPLSTHDLEAHFGTVDISEA